MASKVVIRRSLWPDWDRARLYYSAAGLTSNGMWVVANTLISDADANMIERWLGSQARKITVEGERELWRAADVPAEQMQPLWSGTEGVPDLMRYLRPDGREVAVDLHFRQHLRLPRTLYQGQDPRSVLTDSPEPTQRTKWVMPYDIYAPPTRRTPRRPAKKDMEWLAKMTEMSEQGVGICRSCGEEQSGVEPDARGIKCQACGEPQVYGVEELALRGELDKLPE